MSKREDAVEAEIQEIEDQVHAAVAVKDIAKIGAAFIQFIAIFRGHIHTTDEPNSDPRNPFRSERETSGPVR